MGLFRKNEPSGSPGRAIVVYYERGGNRRRGAESEADDEHQAGRAPGRSSRERRGADREGEVAGLRVVAHGRGRHDPRPVDPETKTVLRLDEPALEEMYRPRIDELKGAQGAVLAAVPARVAAEQIEDVKQVPGDLADAARGLKDALADRPPDDGGLAASDPSRALIDSVDFDMWVAVRAGLVRERVKKKEHDVYAAAAGVPAGQWAAIDAAWFARMNGNPGLAQKFGVAYQRAVKGG